LLVVRDTSLISCRSQKKKSINQFFSRQLALARHYNKVSQKNIATKINAKTLGELKKVAIK